jgi:endonuclease/exonuclease/phosphatase family metal-dependent hydrolase
VVGTEPSGSAATLSVTTFNVWGLPAWINGASSARHRRIASELDRLGSDVVLLQEVWTRQCHRVLAQQTGGPSRTWWTAAARRKGGVLGQNGLLTLSRHPIASAEFRPFASASFPDDLVNKGALKVTLTIGVDCRINVWNVHLQNGNSKAVRRHQIEQLVRWVNDADDGQIADIVGGDFNSTPESAEFQRVAAAVGPSVHQLANSPPLPTWDGLKLSAGTGPAIDHIFVRMRTVGGEIAARPRRVFCPPRREDRLSDHMGIEALLSIRAPEAAAPGIVVWHGPRDGEDFLECHEMATRQ